MLGILKPPDLQSYAKDFSFLTRDKSVAITLSLIENLVIPRNHLKYQTATTLLSKASKVMIYSEYRWIDAICIDRKNNSEKYENFSTTANRWEDTKWVY